MTQQQAQAALEFLKRTELKGVEVPAFNDVVAALVKIATGETEMQEKPKAI